MKELLQGLFTSWKAVKELDIPAWVSPVEQDMLDAIADLSSVASKNTDTVGVLLALGNLYRSQGQIEYAIKIRCSLLERSDPDVRLQARICFELGRDYQRAGLVDRALDFFERAQKLGTPQQEVGLEFARLAADSGNFILAASEYEHLGWQQAAAHFLVRAAEEMQAEVWQAELGKQNMPVAAAEKMVNKALKLYPGAAEAWLFMLRSLLLQQSSASLVVLEKALNRISPSMLCYFLDGLLPLLAHEAFLAEALVALLEKQEPDSLYMYYAGLFLRAVGKDAEAVLYFEKSLTAQGDFWAARLELLDIARQEQELSSVLDIQLQFFIKEAKLVKRFCCSCCGLRLEHTFVECPRCHAWYTLYFRRQLQE